MECVILAGGLGTRLRPLTERVPKTLIEVAGEPFAHHQLRWLAAEGVTDVVYCLGHLGGMVEDALGDGSRFGLRLRYSYDGRRLLGTAGAVRAARDLGLLGEWFYVLYGDSYLRVKLTDVAAAFRAAATPALMTVWRNEGRLAASNTLVEGGRVISYDKQSPTEGMRHIDYGLSVFRRAVIESCVPPGEPADLGDVCQRLAAKGELAAFEVSERFYEIGSPEGIAELTRLITRDSTAAPDR